MSEDLRSIVFGTAGLSAAALVAMVLTITRGPITPNPERRRAAVRLAGATVLLQAVHFAEELATGFHQRFPEQLGLAAWSPLFFVAFNSFWLGVWTSSCPGLVARRRWALAALWFLGIAAVANLVVHPVLSARTGGYFPGLLSSPLLGVLGLLLLRQLLGITARTIPERPPVQQAVAAGPPGRRGRRSRR